MDLDPGRNELGAMGESLQPATPSRHEKSLGLLTTKFVTLLQEAKDGVLDLKAVSVTQGRPRPKPLHTSFVVLKKVSITTRKPFVSALWYSKRRFTRRAVRYSL